MDFRSCDIGRIIIIEDDVDDQFLIRKIFHRLGVGAELLFFENGQEALTYLQKGDTDTFLILCDINMPVMNGIELRTRINRDEELKRKNIPFVFLSTAARPSDVTKAYDLNVQGFFVKESTLHEMEECMKVIMSYWAKCKHPNSMVKQLQ